MPRKSEKNGNVEELQAQSELESLRARITQLEQERDELVRRTSVLVREAQDRTYWLDRWHIDLNRLMELPVVSRLFNSLRGVRRFAGKIKRALKG